jgi:hypothetical protein
MTWNRIHRARIWASRRLVFIVTWWSEGLTLVVEVVVMGSPFRRDGLGLPAKPGHCAGNSPMANLVPARRKSASTPVPDVALEPATVVRR